MTDGCVLVKGETRKNLNSVCMSEWTGCEGCDVPHCGETLVAAECHTKV